MAAVEKAAQAALAWPALGLPFIPKKPQSADNNWDLSPDYFSLYLGQHIQLLGPSLIPSSLTVPQCTILAILLTPILLSFHPKSLFRKALYPVQLYFLFIALLAPFPQPSPSQADLYNLGLLVGTWGARIFDRVYLFPPEETFLQKEIDNNSDDDDDDDTKNTGPGTYSTWRKFLWALELITSARGIGWNWQVSGIPPVPKYESSRWGFVQSRLKKLVITFAAIYTVSVAASLILDTVDTGNRTPLLLHSLFLRLFTTCAWLTVVYGHITLPENIIAVVLVSTGIGGPRYADPRQWPPTFGNISDAWSLRRCWGKFWHAALRRSTNAPGLYLLARFPALRRPQSRLARLLKRYFFLFLAFFISGLIHASGSFMVTRDHPTQRISDGGAMVYFLAQPAAIVLEDLVLYLLGVKDGEGQPGMVRKWVGYAYVVAFWLWAFPTLKLVPLAKAHGLNHGFDDGNAGLLGSVRACKELAEAMPFNPVKALIEKVF